MVLPKSNAPRWLIFLIDMLIAFFSLGIAYLIRFDFSASANVWRGELPVLENAFPFFVFVKALVFYLYKTHYGIVRHTSTQDFKRVFFAVGTATLLFFLLVPIRFFFFDKFNFLPLSIITIEFLLCLFFMVFFRFSVKLIYLESVKNEQNAERVIIYGAGISGLITKRTIEKDVRMPYQIVGFMDDNLKIKNSILEGLKVFHSSKLEQVVKNESVTKLIIAIQNPDEENKKNVIDWCFNHNVEVLHVPSPKSWINGEFSTKQIKKINIEDLLGRKQIALDKAKISSELKGKVILVSGAAGSIGSGLVKQIAQFEPEQLILLDQAESGLYDLQHELMQEHNLCQLEIVVGDIRSEHRMRRLFSEFRPNYVFHAAAYKHVPLMEDNPSEAILTNVKGTKNLVDLSCEFAVFKFVMISTDKAVNPTNVMGASKRIAEMYAQKANEWSPTKFITTRFGNVLGSNGSVIPLFKKQIENGGPLTLTDERVTRFFMTIPEACQLVLEAGAMGKGGEIFVFDMGKPVKIIDLAKNMIRLSGLELGKDIEIKTVGMRPGEKLYEELLNKEENTLPTHNKKILIAQIRSIEDETIANIKELIQLFDEQNNEQIVRQMKKIVPEFISNNSVFSNLDTKH